MKYKFLKDCIGIYNKEYKFGEIYDLEQWSLDFQGKSSKQRNKEGILIVCHGQGEFDEFIIGRDIEKVAQHKTSKTKRNGNGSKIK